MIQFRRAGRLKCFHIALERRAHKYRSLTMQINSKLQSTDFLGHIKFQKAHSYSYTSFSR